MCTSPMPSPVSRRERPAKAALSRDGIARIALDVMRAEGLEVQVGSFTITLRTDRNPFAGGHGHCAGHQRRDSGGDER